MIKTPSFGIGKFNENFVINPRFCPIIGGPCNKDVALNLNKVFLGESYDSHREDREKTIGEVLKPFNLFLEPADFNINNINIFCKICALIQSSNICLIDITNSNSNVLIELGMAYGFQKPTILIFDDNQRNDNKLLKLISRIFCNNNKQDSFIPSNLNGIEYIDYADFDDLKGRLKNSLNRFLNENKTYFKLYDFKKILKFCKMLIMLEEIEVPSIKKFEVLSTNKKRIIINKGKEDGVLEGMCFFIHKITSGIENDDPSCFVEIVHVQDKLSQLKIIYYYDPDDKDEIDDLFKRDAIEFNFIMKKPDKFLESNINELNKIKETINEFKRIID